MIEETQSNVIDQNPKQTLTHESLNAYMACHSANNTLSRETVSNSTNGEVKTPEVECKQRETWSSKLEYLLSCIGFAVGLGNVWRFPYICYKYGGGSFLIPYLLCLALIGIPVFLLEVALGQFTSKSCTKCWECCPLFAGIGYAMVCVSGITAIYYTMIIGYAVYYLFASMTTHGLPWTHCNNTWNTRDCYSRLPDVNCTAPRMFKAGDGRCFSAWNETSDSVFVGIWRMDVFTNVTGRRRVLPAQEYLDHAVLKKTLDIAEAGDSLNWKLALCLLAVWTIAFACTCRGIKALGKVVYVTALFPYAVLLALFCRAVTLPGASHGIYYYLYPRMSALRDVHVWKEAATQIFFSFSTGWGGLVTLSSFNRFDNDLIRDTLIVTLVNAATSLFAGFVVFGFMGYLARMLRVPLRNVTTQGIGLAFVIYPEAVKTLPGSAVWSVLFFLMLITLGLDSQFTLIESVAMSVIDVNYAKLERYRPGILLCICITLFLLGIPLCLGSGPYWLHLIDSYCGGWVLLVIGLFELIVIGWIYRNPGEPLVSISKAPNAALCSLFSARSKLHCRRIRFSEDLQLMLRRKISPCWQICWRFVSPLILSFVLVIAWIEHRPLAFDSFVYPDWANALGALITLACLINIPACAIYLLVRDTHHTTTTHTRTAEWCAVLKQLLLPSHKWRVASSANRECVRDADISANQSAGFAYRDLAATECQIASQAAPRTLANLACYADQPKNETN